MFRKNITASIGKTIVHSAVASLTSAVVLEVYSNRDKVLNDISNRIEFLQERMKEERLKRATRKLNNMLDYIHRLQESYDKTEDEEVKEYDPYEVTEE